MCVSLLPDVIVASEVSERCSFINHFEKNEKLKSFKEYRISIGDCLKKQEKAKHRGIGYVVADWKESDYRNYFDSNSVFVPCGAGNYQVRSEYAESIFKENKYDSNIYNLLSKILEHAYSDKILSALNII